MTMNARENEFVNNSPSLYFFFCVFIVVCVGMIMKIDNVTDEIGWKRSKGEGAEEHGKIWEDKEKNWRTQEKNKLFWIV